MWSHLCLGYKISAELVLDVESGVVVEGLFGGGEAERARPLGLEITRPAVDNADNERIGLALDACGDLLARNPFQRRDLLAAGRGQAGHRERAARADGSEIHGAGMQQEADCRTRSRMPMAHVLG